MISDHFLVVDDGPDIRRLAQEILRDEGYEVALPKTPLPRAALTRSAVPTWSGETPTALKEKSA